MIVCTRDRPDSLRRCLASLRRLDYPEYEVVVVDNAPTADTASRTVAATPFRYVVEERAGLATARNRGVDEARFDILAFTDDDVEADPSWLRGLAHGFADPEVAGVSGQVLPAALETPAQRWFEHYGGGMSRGFHPRTFRRSEMQPRALLEVQAVGVGANMALRRGALDQIGMFDPALGAGTPSGGAEDLDLFHRALVAGLVWRYEPRALVRHHHRSELDGLRRQLRSYGCSYGTYLIKTWRHATVPRAAIAHYAVFGWGAWLIGRIGKRLLGRHPLPIGLLWAELRGALSSPAAYRASYGAARPRRRSRTAPRG